MFVDSYQVERTIEPVYTGGKVALTADENTLLSTVGDTLLLTDLKSGARLLTLRCVSRMHPRWTFKLDLISSIIGR
jgi:hypothetical protein